MLRRLTFPSAPCLELLKSRSSQFSDEVESATKAIVTDVKNRGDSALIEYLQRFESKSSGHQIKVPQSQWDTRCEQVEQSLADALEFAAIRIRRFHESQLPKESALSNDDENLSLKVVPLRSVGLYAPGGTACYPSSVLMTGIPASVAGVERIVLACPQVTDAVLFAAKLAGVTEVLDMGGAQAIAAMAYGTETIPSVDKIVGPGNQWVACAKRLVYGQVDIDSIAGPSEILIWADATANAKFIAADLLAQAEHDIEARAILVTTNSGLYNRVAVELSKQLDHLSRRKIASKSLDDYGVFVLATNDEQALNFVNKYAPEHLELIGEVPEASVEKIYSAGAVFVGPYVPEAAGDYTAGPNHVLPTGGTARFASPLGTRDFSRQMSVLRMNKSALSKQRNAIETIANSEGLDGHARSVAVRFEHGL